MIDLDTLSVHYGSTAVLDRVSARIDEGQLCLVTGPTGCGKSTLLGTIAAQVPHLTGGTLTGRVLVDGVDTRTVAPRDLAGVVGVVGQDPRAAFVTDAVEDELAFTMEQLGVPRPLMRRRVEDVLDLLGLAEVRDRPVASLSGGQAQRVAIGAVLTAQPRVLVLDEPTSALDPRAAEDVLAVLSRLVHDGSLTVVLAEHRLERVVQFADRIISLETTSTGARASVGEPREILATSALAPPVVELARRAGLSPLPVTVRQARSASAALRERLSGADAPARRTPGPVLLAARRLTVRYDETLALSEASLEVRAGAVTGVIGRNGAGKSTLLWTLAGAVVPAEGRVTGGIPPRSTGSAKRRPRRVDPDPAPTRALVPQNPDDLLFRLTVEAECAAADALAGRSGATRELLDDITAGIPAAANPRDLSEGQRLALALAVQLATDPEVLLLDEPTRGLDYRAKDDLTAALSRLREAGRAIVVASHDVEFLAGLADTIVQLACGEVVASEDARTLLTDSMLTAPQVARVLAPLPFVTVAEVDRALEAVR